jgi:hypothetical protein
MSGLEKCRRSVYVPRMRCLLLLVVLWSSGFAFAQDGSALTALKQIPKEAVRKLARIEAREGTPVPERWYFLVHDESAPAGLREYVVAAGRLTADRTLSQFADALSSADVIGGDAVRFNSDQAARLAAHFVAANGARLGSVDYELLRTDVSPAPVWRLTCLDTKGDQVGVLVLSAARGTVLSHDGFEKTPAPELASVPAPPPILAGPTATPKPRPTPATTGGLRPPSATPTPRPTAVRRIGNSFRKLFGADAE